MPNYNKVILIGHVGAKPEIKVTQGGKNVASFTLATTDKSGENKVTQWHKIIAWEKNADLIAAFVDKGHPLMVEGRIAYRNYDDKDGVKRYITEIIANAIQLLKSKDSAPAGQPVGDDEIPF